MATTTKKKESLLKSKDVAHILDCSPDDVIDLARKSRAGSGDFVNPILFLTRNGWARTICPRLPSGADVLARATVEAEPDGSEGKAA